MGENFFVVKTSRHDFRGIFREAIETAAVKAKVPQFNKQGVRANKENIQRMLKERTKLHALIQGKNSTMRHTDVEETEQRIEELNEKILENKQVEVEKEERRAIEAIRTNSKAFFRYANRKRKMRETIGPLRIGKGEDYTSDPKKMAEILSAQYSSVFSDPQDHANLSKLKGCEGTSIRDIKLLLEDFESAMKEIKVGSAPGPDEIPAVVYRKYASELAKPVSMIWRICLDEGVMPEGTILSIITPIYKGDGKGESANYRPVALTNHLTKVFERVVRRHIIKHLEENALLNMTQHGFTNGRSTITQLLVYYDTVLSMLEEKGDKRVDVIYLDFSKAFDKVDHLILLKKTEKLGIGGKLLKWLEVFLTKRVQRVRVEGHLSEPQMVRSGVPQGSVLGPLFFIIMMLDIDAEVSNAKLLSFADDTRLWSLIKSLQDQLKLQHDLDRLYDWADDNNFSFNEKKFEHLSSGDNKLDTSYTTPNTQIIQKKDTVRDLGVHFSSTGCFTEHIKLIVAEAKKLSGYILRTFRTRERGAMVTLMKSLIVSKLEYACVVWAPRDKKLIKMIEEIQRKFTSRIGCFNADDEETGRPICQKDYWERLKELKVFSLERRRERYMVLYLYKVIIGLVPNPGFERIPYNERTGLKFEVKRTRGAAKWVQDLRNASFFSVAPTIFNQLPLEFRNVTIPELPSKSDVEKYKERLDKYLWNVPDQPDIPGVQNRRAAESNSLVHQIRYYTPLPNQPTPTLQT